MDEWTHARLYPGPQRSGSRMRLMRLGPRGRERPYASVGQGLAIDVSDITSDFGPEFFAAGGPELVRPAIADSARPVVEAVATRVGAPVVKPGKIVCIGLNYRDHALETGLSVSSNPAVFLKATNTLIGPFDEVRIPRGSTKTDWEVELGVVIGRTCRYVSDADEALQAVAGYMVSHDVSERAFQLELGGQWDQGKSCETFNPAGPWLVTPDEVGNPSDLELWLDVNGGRRQSGSTGDMILSVGQIVAYVSQYMVLDPGDVINTGTPSGVALGTAGNPYLRAGDVVELGITGLGSQRQQFVAAP